MLKLATIPMNLDLSILGFIRTGRIECPDCGAAHANDRDVDRLYSEGSKHTCDCCGKVLAKPQVAVTA